MTPISMLLFDGFTQLDLTGPYEVLARMEGASIALVAKSMAPVVSDTKLAIVPTHTLTNAPACDVVFVPGGPGVDEVMLDKDVITFVRRQAETARYVTSVCTGALILGAAGLLKSAGATTHWNAVEFLAPFGARHVNERVVVDGNRITGAGVSSGIDFALKLVETLQSAAAAQTIQLLIEYDPRPPFQAGSPAGAGPRITENLRNAGAKRKERRRQAVEEAAKRLP
jgi:cyclohexyl-isocyanide hydratase